MTSPTTSAIDFGVLRRTEYERLDRQQQIYLDYTGSSVYPESVVRRHLDLLCDVTLGNPHSANPTSLASTQMVDETRDAVIRFFRADRDEYEVILTPNATGALKLIGEAYPFDEDHPYALTYDNHNSVNGIREFARAKGATFTYVPITDPELRIDGDFLASLLAGPVPGLLAFPAQSNFSGVQHSLDWIDRAHEHGWHVLLDAAAFVPTNRLDLSRHKPDFVTISFYKMFGYPTGVGALLMRRDAMPVLRRPWFAGGTVLLARACLDQCDMELGFAWESGFAGFEDGTPNFLAMPAVKLGLEYLESIGIDHVHGHVLNLTKQLLTAVVRLQHRNGSRLVHVYGPETVDSRGGTIALNLFDPSGQLVHSREVERAAGVRRISVRTGCHCNPGAGQTALHISDQEFESVFRASLEMSKDRFKVVATALREGAVRVSLGIASNDADLNAFVDLLRTFLDRPAAA